MNNMSFLSNLPSYNRSNFSDVKALPSKAPRQFHPETLTPTYDTSPPPEQVIECDQQHLLLRCYNDNHQEHSRSLLQPSQSAKRKREEKEELPHPAPPPKNQKLE